MTDSASDARPARPPMALLYSYLRRYWGLVALALVLAAINQVFSLLDPLIFRHVIDQLRHALPASTRPASSSAAWACCWRRRWAWPSSPAWPRTSRTTSST